uniref:Uncharacterized protein n=1 Tax=Craspedostauros australis TaxID=1486917 RepID=A0A6T6FYD2_9STRA|mmetsp:Transcript_21846/g.60844  ORF Transcript_21846/g.60844 Transcript_21846/m.60844 type:complete len:169 (+) Transcript_21846:199-705(+)|eukprot:CAMPEP_0198118300 /NCGR_PEP_ID=MMETSP1442-20131203/21082_1 /TAXON_ID= /ORGANISM="Craspedostauros australis, Strain CCMP3328" /LENGTH=168 /DNA_ID=CAMNT_0043776529 /DNA_START=172 /DNA_END=678 /DNA_ORIENTATION=-
MSSSSTTTTNTNAGGNVFLTTENLAFSLPLILVCSLGAFFTYVPLKYGAPILGVVGLLIYAKMQIKTIQDKKLQNMDAKAMDDIARELQGDDSGKDEKAEAKAKLQAKKKHHLQQRLAAEKRKEEKQAAKNKSKPQGKGKKKGGDDDDDDGDLAVFAKGSRASGKKKK